LQKPKRYSQKVAQGLNFKLLKSQASIPGNRFLVRNQFYDRIDSGWWGWAGKEKKTKRIYSLPLGIEEVLRVRLVNEKSIPALKINIL
jgi:hypothetical protein